MLADAAADVAEADQDIARPPVTRETWDAMAENAQFDTVALLQTRLKAAAARLHKRASAAVAAAEAAQAAAAAAPAQPGDAPSGVQVVGDGAEAHAEAEAEAEAEAGGKRPADVVVGSTDAMWTGSAGAGAGAGGGAMWTGSSSTSGAAAGHGEAVATAGDVMFGMVPADEPGHASFEAEATPEAHGGAGTSGSPAWK